MRPDERDPPVTDLAADPHGGASRKPPRRSRLRRWAPLIGIGLFAFILSRLDAQRFGHALSAVSPLAFLLAALCFSFNMWLKAVRWRRMLAMQAIALPREVALATFFAAQFYGQVTLGRVGELFRAEALLERGVSFGRALSSCVFDRVLDLYLVLSLSVLLGALLLGRDQVALWAGSLWLLATAAGVWIARSQAGAGSAALRARVSRWLGGLSQVPLVGRVTRTARDMLAGVGPLLRPLPLLESMAWTTVGWFFYLAALWVLAWGMAIDASLVLLTAAATLAALSSLLPVTVSGLGARELIYVEMLRRVGVASERAVVLSLCHLLVMTVCAVGLGAIGLRARSRQAPAPASPPAAQPPPETPDLSAADPRSTKD